MKPLYLPNVHGDEKVYFEMQKVLFQNCVKFISNSDENLFKV